MFELHFTLKFVLEHGILDPKLKRRACYTRAGTESRVPRQHARLEEMGLLRPAALGSGVLCLNEKKR